MKADVVAGDSAWDAARIDAYLDATAIPVRLACLTETGAPFVASVWFVRDGDALLACVQEDAFLAVRFRDDARCGFEVGADDPPYRGVRGRGEVSLERTGRAAVLDRLVRRYLGDGNRQLGDWLRSRVDSELVLRIRPLWLTAWDYSGRMKEA